MEEKEKKKGNKIVPIVIGLILLVAVGGCLFAFRDKLFGSDDGGSKKKSSTSHSSIKNDLKMEDNNLSDFDLYFLKLENTEKNKIYSPLSIKYALEMLAEGAKGDTRDQIEAVIGDYVAKSYTNNKNMSFGNALFVRDTFKDSLNKDYVEVLKKTYNAEVLLDSFATPKLINDWVNKKTFELIPNLMDDVSDLDYVLVNALAIDMEWKNKIQSPHETFSIEFEHEKYKGKDYDEYGVWVSALDSSGYSSLDFEGAKNPAKSVRIAAVAHKYDIIKELGEDNIRKTVQTEYDKWKKENPEEAKYFPFSMDDYIKELKTNYGKLGASTDFLFYDDNDIKAFAKDLKTYDGVTLQYVGIMPKNEKLVDYVKNSDAKSINKVIGDLRTVTADNFEEGYVTVIEGNIPMFNYSYELDLQKDLNELGIKDVFDLDKADLSNISSNSKTAISKSVHKANIEFSNDGIKASAATAMGGAGAADGGFNYWFDVPVKIIDMSFNKPFMYVIRDKDTGEVWFTGTVYEPTKFEYQELDW